MPYYRVYFKYILYNKVKHESIRLDAKNKEDAKRQVIRGEKPKLIAIDRIERL